MTSEEQHQHHQHHRRSSMDGCCCSAEDIGKFCNFVTAVHRKEPNQLLCEKWNDITEQRYHPHQQRLQHWPPLLPQPLLPLHLLGANHGGGNHEESCLDSGNSGKPRSVPPENVSDKRTAAAPAGSFVHSHDCVLEEFPQQQQQQQRARSITLDNVNQCPSLQQSPQHTLALSSKNLSSHLKQFEFECKRSESVYGVALDLVELERLKADLIHTFEFVTSREQILAAAGAAAASRSLSDRSVDDGNDCEVASVSSHPVPRWENDTVEHPATDNEPKKPAAKRRKLNETQPGVESSHVVYFGWINHPGTRKWWREVVKRFSDDRIHYSTWTDRIGQEIIAICANEYKINRFFVSQNQQGKKKIIMNSRSKTWELACEQQKVDKDEGTLS